ncbi:aldo/keto reductase [Williamsia sp. D3]|uniref:aldo/keto reductase n=1 Tax=Williamsia sp. D3 TaxID=1313067 RepID=UPI0003D34572|nr:aldo/keto reductase [Williamsia sp. D3]ETD32961.1 NADP-dependent aryl-alcohol dehydrogenase [Williamsia sp. D3]
MSRIGSSDLDVYPLNLGGNTFGWTSDAAESFAVLDAFVSAGGNFIDTSDSYMASAPGNVGGESETILGEWFTKRGRRDDIVLATKVSRHPEFLGLAPDNIARAAEASLRRLKTDHIDLYYAHYDDPDVPLADTLGAFDALVKAGKVRHIGISNYSAERIKEWIDVADANRFANPIALQPHYSLVARQPFEEELRPLAEKFGLGVFPYWALASGFLTGKYRTAGDVSGVARSKIVERYFNPEGLAVVDELDRIARSRGVQIATVALAWTRQQPTVVAPIVSARSPEQLEALLGSVDLTLTVDELARLDDVSAKVPADQ